MRRCRKEVNGNRTEQHIEASSHQETKAKGQLMADNITHDTHYKEWWYDFQDNFA